MYLKSNTVRKIEEVVELGEADEKLQERADRIDIPVLQPVQSVQLVQPVQPGRLRARTLNSRPIYGSRIPNNIELSLASSEVHYNNDANITSSMNPAPLRGSMLSYNKTNGTRQTNMDARLTDTNVIQVDDDNAQRRLNQLLPESLDNQAKRIQSNSAVHQMIIRQNSPIKIYEPNGIVENNFAISKPSATNLQSINEEVLDNPMKRRVRTNKRTIF